jgi:N-acetyl-alpha-D-glucosaminyl L-malate synthase BshA
LNLGIVCYPSHGGSGVVASELGKALIKKGHTVHFFSYKVPFRLDPLSDGFKFHEVKDPSYPLFEYPSYGMALASRIVAVARKEKLDCIHVHYAYPHSISAFIAREILNREARFVTTLHGTDITLVGQDPNFFDLVKFGIECSDGVTAVSESLRKTTIDLFQPKVDIRVIPNFIDTSLFRPIKGGPNKGEKTVVHISNFRQLKRPLDFIRVAARMRNTRFLMVGNGPMYDEVVSQAGSNVFFCDLQRDVIRLIQTADVMLITSEVESFGLAALEAMSCGVPVVGTRCGGLEELIKDGVHGYLCQVGDIDGMAERIGQVLDDDGLYTTLSMSARERAKEFDINKVVPIYEDVYNA